MILRKIKAFSIGLLAFLYYSCSNAESESVIDSGKPMLTFGMTRSTQNIINNTQVYRFATDWNFRQKVQDVIPGTDNLSMNMPAGSWNIALVTADKDITSNITSPVKGQERKGKMWETKVIGGELPSVPELRTAFLDNVDVVANTTNTAGPVDLSRNVALVKVVIDNIGGLKTDAGTAHEIELNQVPTTLDWAGKVMPNTTTPYVGSVPMKGTFKISDMLGDTALQQCDTLEFVIPAHMGNDYLSASPVDTLKSKLTISINLKSEYGSDIIKQNMVIPYVPRVNRILFVQLDMLSQIKVYAKILDWYEVDLKAYPEHRKLQLDKVEVGLSYRDTINVDTNAADFTVAKDPSASWLTATKRGDKILLEANTSTYVDNTPRSSYITIKAGNITKKVPVTQRPDRGTISVDNKRLVFCPVNHVTRSAKITSIGGDWKFITQTHKATPNILSGTTSGDVTFKRASTTNHDDFNKYYGDSIIVVKNMKTLDTDTIEIVNCFIDIYDNIIQANAPNKDEKTAVTVSEDIIVYGGSKDLVLVSASHWINNIKWDPVKQELALTTERDIDDEERDGKISFAHAECKDYVVEAIVHQDMIITIPAFDYFVVKFTWNHFDVDIAVEFAGNNIRGDGSHHPDYDKIPVGYGMHKVKRGKGFAGAGGGSNQGRVSFSYNGGSLLTWGGDAVKGEGETAFFNANLFEGDRNSPRKINLEIYSIWFARYLPVDKDMTLSMYAYKGGFMKRGTGNTLFNNKFNFYNSGGSVLYSKAHYVTIDKVGDEPEKYETSFSHVATVTYDRIKHSATIKMHIPYKEVPSTQKVKNVPLPANNASGVGQQKTLKK